MILPWIAAESRGQVRIDVFLRTGVVYAREIFNRHVGVHVVCGSLRPRLTLFVLSLWCRGYAPAKAMSIHRLQPSRQGPLAKEAAIARWLLFQHPVAHAHAVHKVDEAQLLAIWLTWLDRADAIALYAGDTRPHELVVRSLVFALLGVGIGWLIAGFPLAWIGLGLPLVVFTWWLVRRRAWHRSARFHILWGAVLAAEYKRRLGAQTSESAVELLGQVFDEVNKFKQRYETWIGKLLIERIE